MRAENKNMTSMNAGIVFDIIRGNGPVDNAKIALLAGLSIENVIKITAGLAESRLIKNIREAPSSGGRRTEMLVFDKTAYYLIGAEAGRKALRVVITDLSGSVGIKLEAKTGKDLSSRAVTEGLTNLIDAAISGSAIPKLCLLGLGIGIRGALDPQSGRIVSSHDFPWTGADLRTPLQNRFKLHTAVVEADQAIESAKGWYGAGRDCGEDTIAAGSAICVLKAFIDMGSIYIRL